MAADIGLDSIQFQFNQQRHTPEIALVSPAFARNLRPVLTCPPLAYVFLRAGFEARGRYCGSCNDSEPMLNCGSRGPQHLPGMRDSSARDDAM